MLSEAGLPGSDFVLKGVGRDVCRFATRLASYNDAVSMMRTLLILCGMEADAAVKFTLHSWRHLMTTMARQLRLPEAEQVEIGHWSGSAMPRRYDSAACVTELSAKASIRSAIHAGWSLVDPGCVALPPAAPTLVVAPVVPSASWAKSKARRSAAGPPSKAAKKCNVFMLASDVSVLELGR